MGTASTAPGRPGFRAADALLPLGCIAIVILNRRHGGPFFLDATPDAPLWHGLRALLAPVFLLIAHGTGRVVMEKAFRDKAGNWPAGCALLTGFAVFTGLAFVLAALGWYTYPVFLAAFVVLAGLSARQQRLTLSGLVSQTGAAFHRLSWPQRIGRAALWLVAAGAAALILLAKGIYPDYGGDIFQYFLYYQQALASGSLLAPAFDHFIYFPAKASGLHYFLAVLCGLQALPYASCAYFVLLCLGLWGFLNRITKNPLYFRLGLLVVSTNFEMLVFTNNFSKTNFYGAVLIFYLGYLVCEALFSRDIPQDRRRVLWAMAVCGFQTAFFTIQALLFAGALLGGLWLYEGLLRHRLRSAILAPAILMLAVAAALFLYNLGAVGYLDMATVRWQLSPTSFRLHDPVSITKQFELHDPGQDWPGSAMADYPGHVAQLLASSGFLGTTFAPGWWLALIAAGFFAFRERGRSPLAACWLAPLAAMFLFYVLACSFIGPEYYRKHSMFIFGILFKMTLYLGSFALVERYVVNPFRQKVGSDRPAGFAIAGGYAVLVLFLVGATALRAMPFNLRDDLRERVEYLVGKRSSNTVFMNYYPYLKVCSQTLSVVRGPFLPLTGMTACLGYSGGRMLDLYAPALQSLVPALMGGNVQDALEGLGRQGIEAFPVDFAQEPTPLAFAPIFSPQSLEHHFVVQDKLGDTAATLRPRRPDDAPLDAAFLDAYRAYLEKHAAHRTREAYRRFSDWLRTASPQG